MTRILFVGSVIVSLAGAFSTTSTASRQLETTAIYGSLDSDNDASNNHRRTFLESSAASALAAVGLSSTFPQPSIAAAEEEEVIAPPTKTTDGEGVIMYKTDSGLKYIELESGSAANNKRTPRYGQLCVVSYKAYLKLPNSKNKEQFDSASGYIIKHGNGKMLPGLDEGLHTMKKGDLRRVIIPPKLGFVRSGLGPLPEYPWNRYKLNRLLEDMVTQRGGNLVYDVRLEDFFDDEADQGYYDDAELSAEEMEIIQNKFIRRPPPSLEEGEA